jgi:hypothetical protein
MASKKPKTVENKDTSDVVDYSATANYKNISELLNNTFIITGIKQEERTFADRKAVLSVITVNNEEYYTFSSVLARQLQEIQPLIAQGKKVRVKLVKKKRYLTLASPEE